MKERIKELRERKQSALDEAQVIATQAESEDRDLTESEKAEYQRLMDEAQGFELRAARLEKNEQARASDDAAEARRNLNVRQAARETGAPTGTVGEHAEFRNIGDFICAVANRDLKRLKQVEERDMEMGGGYNDATGGPTGGYAVPEQFRDQIMEMATTGSVIRPGATVIPAGSPPDAKISIPTIDFTEGRYGGVEVAWIGEGELKPETAASLDIVNLTPHELAAHVIVTDKLMRNWQAADTVVRRLLQGALAAAQDLAFIQGSGTGQPDGIINHPAAYEVARTDANQVTYEDIVAMYARMFRDGGTTPVWITSQSVIPQLLTLRNETPGGDGALIFQPGLREGMSDRLMGYPILFSERVPQLGSEGDLMFVDRSYYVIKDGSGPFVAASPHVHFTTNRTVIKIFTNVDGKPWPNDTLTLENGYTVSPFVVLDVPGS